MFIKLLMRRVILNWKWLPIISGRQQLELFERLGGAKFNSDFVRDICE